MGVSGGGRMWRGGDGDDAQWQQTGQAVRRGWIAIRGFMGPGEGGVVGFSVAARVVRGEVVEGPRWHGGCEEVGYEAAFPSSCVDCGGIAGRRRSHRRMSGPGGGAKAGSDDGGMDGRLQRACACERGHGVHPGESLCGADAWYQDFVVGRAEKYAWGGTEVAGASAYTEWQYDVQPIGLPGGSGYRYRSVVRSGVSVP